MFLQTLRAQIRHARSLSRILRRRDALRLARAIRPAGPTAVCLKPLGRAVHLRPGTADLYVLEKIFLQLEYAVQFPLAARRIIDAGAHIGLASLFFADRYPESEIVALEPDAANFALLAENCAGQPRIRPIPGALWSQPARLTGDVARTGTDSFAVAEAANGQGSIRGWTVGELMAERGWEQIDLLKLDIEGAELNLFSRGDRDWLRKVRMIAIELHDRFVPGCSRAFYQQVAPRLAAQEIRGENVIVLLEP